MSTPARSRARYRRSFGSRAEDGEVVVEVAGREYVCRLSSTDYVRLQAQLDGEEQFGTAEQREWLAHMMSSQDAAEFQSMLDSPAYRIPASEIRDAFEYAYVIFTEGEEPLERRSDEQFRVALRTFLSRPRTREARLALWRALGGDERTFAVLEAMDPTSAPGASEPGRANGAGSYGGGSSPPESLQAPPAPATSAPSPTS